MDPASLTLGILPLVIAVIKSYSTLKTKLEIFRHCSRELRRIRQRLDLERRLFLNETRILVLTAVEDHLLVTHMLDDTDHPEWHSPEVERAFRVLLEGSFDEYSDTINTISEAIQEMRTEIDRLSDVFESEQHDNERLKETIHRLRGRVKMTLNKTKLEESLAELNESNGSLQRLGGQMRKIREITAEMRVAKDRKTQLSQEYADFGMVRRASKAFHSALANAWSSQTETCQRLSALQHNVRFFLDTKVLNSVSMDLIMVCPGHMARSLPAPRPLRLQVKSQVLQWVDTGLQSPPTSIRSVVEGSQSRVRKVRFQDDEPEPDNTEPLKQQSHQRMTDNLDIPNLSSRDLCSFLQQTRSGPALDKCVGYIDSCCDEAFRHSIYSYMSSAHSLQQVVSIDKVLDSIEGESMNTVDQLSLARSLVAAVLKFHSTPWLAQYLTLRDISVFQSSQDFSRCLPTLHFDTNFENTQIGEATPDASMAGTRGQEDATNAMATVIENAELDHGIRNMTLWCLGVILLQIGHWSSTDESHDVRKVRRLSMRRTDISPRYDELTRRCLDCDFGEGNNLTQPRLRQAVYDRVYCELVSMIDSLTISED